ncbi:hypothetical protein E2C01_100154 [Portunus trituberculatus]|uniref:Uncharacterized protein n=1 Tax=Portunus trituberculatus TaxID=210409 RepID=A0A5B7K7A9_PORTR|nr:hypothetical protein [Portunus trituberculatus]
MEETVAVVVAVARGGGGEYYNLMPSATTSGPCGKEAGGRTEGRGRRSVAACWGGRWWGGGVP